MAENAKWYVIHTYSGYENAVKAAIEKSVTNRHCEDMVLRMEIPMETVTEVTESGTMKEVERKVFPGYVLIKMVLTDETWHIIRNIRGVTGFVGEANKAIPLTEEEVRQMSLEKHEIVVKYNVGETVKITDGPLASFTGGGDRSREEQGSRGGLHVRQRDTGGAGARSGGGPVLTHSSLCASGRDAKDTRVSPRAVLTPGKPLPHFIKGGALKWHRKSLVM